MKYETEKKIEIIRRIIISKLHLVSNVDKDFFLDFCNKLTVFLRQDRNTDLLKYDEKKIKEKLDKLIIFFNNLEFNYKDIIDIIYKNYRFIDTVYSEDFYNKYILFSVIENTDNTLRKNLLKKDPREFNKPLDLLFAKYCFTKESGRTITKGLLLNDNYSVFINKFVNNSYIRQPHEILREAIPAEKLIERYPFDINVIKELKKDDCNNNVSYYKQTDKEVKIKRAIDNFNKVSSLKELSNLINISTSSLQRYLKEDSVNYTDRKTYDKIQEWLKESKRNGNQLGGKVSHERYGFSKDQGGHFKGSGRK